MSAYDHLRRSACYVPAPLRSGPRARLLTTAGNIFAGAALGAMLIGLVYGEDVVRAIVEALFR